MESYLTYNFKIYSFKIIEKHLENIMVTFPLYIFRDQKFDVLFVWSLWLAFQWVLGSEQGSLEVSQQI